MSALHCLVLCVSRTYPRSWPLIVIGLERPSAHEDSKALDDRSGKLQKKAGELGRRMVESERWAGVLNIEVG